MGKKEQVPARAIFVQGAYSSSFWVLGVWCKERKNLKKEKTHATKEGWEDGTPPPHRDFKGRKVCF